MVSRQDTQFFKSKLKLILLSSPVALVVQHAYLYPAPDISLELVPDALLGENFPVGCCIGGSRIPDVPGTVHPDLGTHIVPGIFYHISFSRNLGSSRDRNDLGCCPLFACH